MSEEILSQEEIDALLEGLAGGREVGDLTEAILRSSLEDQETSGSGLDLREWETDYLPANRLEEMSENYWGSVIYSGDVDAVGFFRIRPPRVPEEEADSGQETTEPDSLSSFIDDFLGSLRVLVSDARGLDIRAEAGQLADAIPEVVKSDGGRWYEIKSLFDSPGGEWEVAFGLPEPIRIAVTGDRALGEADAGGDLAPASGTESRGGTDPGETKVSRARFPEFGRKTSTTTTSPREDRMDVLLDVPLQVSVELGRSIEDIRGVMAIGTGSIIELDRQAGEPVDVLVNGKLLARGEVVVVDESFAVRITEIVSLEDRIRSLR
ncbi:MAG: flagellar motor switch protein FliN [Clostridia bacterium]